MILVLYEVPLNVKEGDEPHLKTAELKTSKPLQDLRGKGVFQPDGVYVIYKAMELGPNHFQVYLAKH